MGLIHFRRDKTLNESHIDVFLSELDKLNIRMCPHMEMEEKYCKYYKHEVSGYTGGFCTCHDDCNSCDKKTWSDCVGPVDKDWKLREEEKHLVKLQRENHQITDYLQMENDQN